MALYGQTELGVVAPTKSEPVGTVSFPGSALRASPTSSRGVSSFTLKIIAIVSMTMNHGANMFSDKLPFEALCILFGAGGLTFPIMAFLLVEGYRHTSSVKKYALRLAIFAVIAQVPYGLFLASMPNVLFTLLVGLGILYAHDHVENRGLFWLLFIVATLATIYFDWGLIGIVVIYLFKSLEGQRFRICIPLGITSLAFGLPAVSLLGANLIDGGSLSALPSVLYALIACPLAIPLLAGYRGRRGVPMKYFFYAYYPLHILVLALVYFFLFGIMPS